jgi:hypothetical protein
MKKLGKAVVSKVRTNSGSAYSKPLIRFSRRNNRLGFGNHRNTALDAKVAVVLTLKCNLD